jgi:hypothetical protein
VNPFDHENQGEHPSDSITAPPQELFNLLSDRALFGLEVSDTEKLNELLARHPWVRDEYMDNAVARMAVEFEAHDPESEPMPQALADRITDRLKSEANQTTPEVAGRIEPRIVDGSGGSVGWLGWIGWAAAAAALVFAATLWEPDVRRVGNATQLVSWVEAHPDAVRWDWSPGLVNPTEGVTGYVTFSPEAQEGFMMIKGLEPNDPRIEQYQLWIWDREREPDPDNPQPLAENVHPVDGGVFNVNDDGEVVVPMKLPLRVGQPYLFAVTVERPGGVVKSDKSWVPIIAGPPADA